MEATLEAVKREGRGKNAANRLRAEGKIPAVVYGTRKGEQAPDGVPVAVDPKSVLRILHSDTGANTLISLKLDGAESRVMVKEYQLDPVTHALLHADFYQLALDRAITVPIPIQLKGEPKGVKLQGGIVDFVTRELEVECLPTQIPEHVEVDISELEMNQAIRVRDLAESPTWKAITEPDTMIVHVVAIKAEEPAPVAEAAVAPAAPAEPEVIKKGKTEKEEEAPAAKEKK
jgi:large subunit ribosomal protein L25